MKLYMTQDVIAIHISAFEFLKGYKETQNKKKSRNQTNSSLLRCLVGCNTYR